MNHYFKILCKIFDAGRFDVEEIENGDWENAEFQFMYNEIGISATPKTNPMLTILNHIYLKDDISLLGRLLGTNKTVTANTNLNLFIKNLNEVIGQKREKHVNLMRKLMVKRDILDIIYTHTHTQLLPYFRKTQSCDHFGDFEFEGSEKRTGRIVKFFPSCLPTPRTR